MKEVTLKIREDKYPFFVELIRNFNFIKINNKPSEKEILVSVARGMKEAELATKGKLKTKSAKAFINAL